MPNEDKWTEQEPVYQTDEETGAVYKVVRWIDGSGTIRQENSQRFFGEIPQEEISPE